MQNLAKAALLAALVVLAPACRHSVDKFLHLPGSYDGFVVRKISGRSTQVFAHGTLARPKAGTFTLAVDGGDAGKWEFVATLHGQAIRIEAPTLFQGPLDLEVEGRDCWHSKKDVSPVLRVCFDGNEVAISEESSSEEWIFILDKHADKDQPVLEEPKPFTVRELLDRAKDQSFTSELQFQAAVQSRLNSLNAHLQLLPHVSFNDVYGLFSMVTFNWTALLKMVGDLAPFLLPQNWANAAALHWQAEADYQALLTMKADAGSIAEGLAYAELRDRETRSRLATYEGPISQLRDTLIERENLGVAPPHSADGLTQILSSLKEAGLMLEQTIAQEHHALASAVGFVNPDAISAISAPERVEVETPVELDLEGAKRVAIARSPELRQLDSLVRAARDNALARDFFWMDPNGGGEGLGFGFPVYLRAGYIKVKQLEIQRRQLQSTLLTKVEDSALRLTTIAARFRISRENLAVQTGRVAGMRESMELGIAVEPTSLQQALQDQLRSETDLVNAKYEYAVAAGTLHRLLLDGPYLDILTQVETGRPPQRP